MNIDKYKSTNVYHLLLIALFFVTSSASKCGKQPLTEAFYNITVINNSADSVCAFLADKHSTAQYPDTLLPIGRPALFVIAPSKRYYHYSREPWLKEFGYLPADTLSIFIVNAKLYKDSLWSVIRGNNRILKRYDLSYRNLESLKFYVPYPPSAEMAGMKMYL